MMENVCVGAKYDSKKFGMVVVISIDEKTKLVRFHKVNSDKQEIPMTTSSFKKGFRLAEMPAGQSEEKKATTKAPKAEKPEKTASKKSEKQAEPKAPKKDRNAVAMSYTERARKVAEGLGYVTNTYKGMPTDLVVREDKKRLFEIYFSNKNIKVYTNSNRVPEGFEYKTVKSSFDASVPMNYPENDKDFEKLVKSILAWEVA